MKEVNSLKRAAILCFTAVCVLAVVAYADAPINGIYQSPGDLDEGRFSECWVGGGQGQLGNTVHALSWDGTDLGLQWKLLCPYIAEAPELIEDTVDEFGNGHRVYRTIYTGGEYWLSGTGAWSGGDPDYLGYLEHYVHTTTMQISGGEVVAYTTNAQMTGRFYGYQETCMQLTIANAALVGMGGVPPADYPTLQDGTSGTCVAAAGGYIGEWGNVWAITLIIQGCEPTATEESSWGTIKSLYR
jgi:hypothetical protein